MEIDTLLQKIEVLNETYVWSIKEANRIVAQMDRLMESDDIKKFDKIEKLRDQFMELQVRHVADKKLYDQVVNESRDYFKIKYNIDIKELLEGENEEAN